MPLSRVAVILMAKYPEAGRVKTRLTPELSPEQAAAVHGVFLRHLAARIGRLNPAELVVCFDPPAREGDMRALFRVDTRDREESDPAGVGVGADSSVSGMTFVPQCAGDLGCRISAAARALAPRHARLLFMGVDSPDVPVPFLFKAAELIEQTPVSLSPTDDGGYWSLGLQREVDVAALLADIPWSSGTEAFATLQAADRLEHTACTGLAWDDVDRPADLRRLVTRLTQSEAAADRELLSKLAHVLPPGWCS